MSDPQAIQAPKGQTYGQAGQQRAAQQVVPVAGQPSPPTPATGAGGAGTPLPGMEPGQIPSLEDPTALPNQPIQAGLPDGPGPGMEGLTTASLDRDLTILKMIYQQYPMDELSHLIEWSEAQVGSDQLPPEAHATAVVPNPPVPNLVPEEHDIAIQDAEGDPTGMPVGSQAEAEALAQQMTQGVQDPGPSDPPTLV